MSQTPTIDQETRFPFNQRKLPIGERI